MSTVLDTRLTADDLLRLPNGDRYELVDGELVERVLGCKAVWVAGEVFVRLREHAKQHGGLALGEGAGYRCFGADREQVLKPDASFVAHGRLPNDEAPEGFIVIPPDLVVEVVSPSDIFYEVEHKIGEYLDAGVRIAWIVNPESRSVWVFEADGDRPYQLSADDELSGGNGLPGLTVTIAELFPAERSA